MNVPTLGQLLLLSLATAAFVASLVGAILGSKVVARGQLRLQNVPLRKA